MKWMTATLAIAAALMISVIALAETVHQTTEADKMYTGDGKNAVEKGQVETKKIKDSESDKVGRIAGSMPQWGFVTCWFGIPAPAGKSIVRFRIYVEDQPTAKYALYIANKSGQTGVGNLKLPADAKPSTFVTVDVPINAKEEWSGLTIKKTEKSELASPWFDTISIVIPD